MRAATVSALPAVPRQPPLVLGLGARDPYPTGREIGAQPALAAAASGGGREGGVRPWGKRRGMQIKMAVPRAREGGNNQEYRISG